MIRPGSGERREHRRARADHDVDVAAADAVPLIVALAVRQAAVLDRDRRAEPRAEQRRHLRRERDLRDQHQHAAAAGADRIRQPQVHLGLAAAGHAVEQRDVERPGGGERQQLDPSPPAAPASACARRPAPDAGTAAETDRDRSARVRMATSPSVCQPRERGGRYAALGQSGDRQAVRRPGQERQRLTLARSDARHIPIRVVGAARGARQPIAPRRGRPPSVARCGPS